MTKVYFYKAFQWKWSNWTDWLIGIRTFGFYSHVEIMLPDDKCFTASGRDNAVRIKKIDVNNEGWELLETDLEIDYKILNEMLGQKYDKIGILLTEVFPFGIQDPNKAYCSEAVSRVLHIKPSNIDPVRLYKFLKARQKRLEGVSK